MGPDTGENDRPWPWPDYMGLYYEAEYLRIKWAETLRELMETKILLEEVTARAIRAEQRLDVIKQDLPNYYKAVEDATP